MFTLASNCKAWFELFELATQLVDLRLIARQVQRRFCCAPFGLLEISLLSLTQLATVLNGLFSSRDLGADLVVATLHRVERFGLLGEVFTGRFDRGLDRTQIRNGRLHLGLTLAQDAFLRLRILIDEPQAQSKQLGRQLALVLLQRLIAACRGRLALQMAQLLVDFLSNVAQAFEIFLRVRNAILGFATALLVLGDAGRLFDEAAQLFGTCLDHPRDHSLLDDRVAACTETRAEEQLRDVLASAADAVQKVCGLPIARDHALERHLVVACVLSCECAVGIVEHELHGCSPNRLARRRAVEHDVGHGITAQMLRGDLAHDPADGIDDVGLAAAIRADDADEVAWQAD